MTDTGLAGGATPRRPHFEVVNEPEVPPVTSRTQQAATKMLMLALTALAQRTIQALADLFCLLTVASVFWIAYTIDDPDPMKLTKLGMYASFVLIVNWIVRRK